MARTVLRVALMLIVATGLVACSRGGATESPTTQAVTTSTAPAVSSPVATSGTPPAGPRLGPPIMWLVGAAGKEPGAYGSYYWQLQNGLAIKVAGRGFEIQKDPLKITKGQQIRFEATEGPTPTTISIKLYPRDGNIQHPEATPGTGAGATPSAGPGVFRPTTEPITSVVLPPGTLDWTVNAAPGSYFLYMQGVWPNPFDRTKPLDAEFSYLIEVS